MKQTLIVLCITTSFFIFHALAGTVAFEDSGPTYGKATYDTLLKKFKRHGLDYVDKIVHENIVGRLVYDNEKIIYRYPVTPKNIGHGIIRIFSGNTYLLEKGTDTFFYSNSRLPIMNRHIYTKGSAINQINDSTWSIKCIAKGGSFVKIFVDASDNYEEVKPTHGFVVDSFIILVR